MSFFSEFPKVVHDVAGSKRLLTNILRRIGIKRTFKENAGFFIDYTVKNSDTPEIIADKLYDAPTRHWLPILANDIIDPQFDWVQDQSMHEKLVSEKYPGRAIFPLIDFVSPAFFSALDFAIGDGVVIVRGDNVIATGQVHAWNKSLFKLEVTGISQTLSLLVGSDKVYEEDPLNAGQALLDGPNFVVGRDIAINAESLHHFEDDDGRTVDAWRNDPLIDTSPLIKAYIDEKKSIETIITNRIFEDNINEDKRSIRLIRNEFVDNIEQGLESQF